MIWKKDILVCGEGPTTGLDDTTITVEFKYSAKFLRFKSFIWIFIIMETWVFIFVNATKIYQFKPDDSEIKPYLLFLGNISNFFPVNNMKIMELNCVYDFFWL